MRAYKDKSHYSFLLGFVRQLAAALEDDSDDDLAAALVSLGTSLAVLIADEYPGSGEDDDGDDESIDSDDEPGNGPALGGGVDRLPAGHSAALDQPYRELGSSGRTALAERVLGGKRRRASVLKNGKGKRRGAK